jgi:hypothetical protein
LASNLCFIRKVPAACAGFNVLHWPVDRSSESEATALSGEEVCSAKFFLIFLPRIASVRNL